MAGCTPYTVNNVIKGRHEVNMTISRGGTIKMPPARGKVPARPSRESTPIEGPFQRVLNFGRSVRVFPPPGQPMIMLVIGKLHP